MITFDTLICSLLICKDENTQKILDDPRAILDECICDSVGRFEKTEEFPFERFESYDLDMVVLETLQYINFIRVRELEPYERKIFYNLILKMKNLNEELRE